MATKKRVTKKVKSTGRALRGKASSAKSTLAAKKRWLVVVLILIILLVLMNINRLDFTFL
jgi:hypothetical protein